MARSNRPRSISLPPGDHTLSTTSHSDTEYQQLVDDFLIRRSEKTRLAYRTDLRDFAVFIEARNSGEALRRLVGVGQGPANALVLSYKNSLIQRRLAPATINRRLSTLRSALRLARRIGLVNWSIEIENEKVHAYRETSGSGKEGFRVLLQQAARSRNQTKAIRDVAILRLLFDLALRRGEIVSLDLADYDPNAGTLAVLGKGRSQKLILTLPDPTRDALSAWIDARSEEPGPMFTNCDRAGKGAERQNRLTGSAIYYLVRDLGRRAGINARPHGIRHAAITEALDITRGDVRAVQRFSRHQNIQTVTVYDDNRQDLAGEVAKKIAESV